MSQEIPEGGQFDHNPLPFLFFGMPCITLKRSRSSHILKSLQKPSVFVILIISVAWIH